MAMLQQASFEHALTDAGSPVEDSFRFEGLFMPSAGHRAVEWLLETHGSNMPTAIFFASSRMDRSALAAFANGNIKVSGDITVTSYDLYPGSGGCTARDRNEGCGA